MATYDVELFDPYGNRLSDLNDFNSLTYARADGQVGKLKIVLSYGCLNTSYVKKDGLIAVMRQVGAGLPYLDLETMWLIRNTQTVFRNNIWTYIIEAFDGNYLLKGRSVDYAPGTGREHTSGYADNIMKTVVSQNMDTTCTDTTRAWPTALFTNSAGTSLGASLAKSYGDKNVLPVCQDLAQSSTQAGTFLTFDTVWNGAKFEFRTYTGQRGVDHRWPVGINPVIFDPEMGNLADVTLENNAENEITRVCMSGKVLAQDTTRQGETPFGLREATLGYSAGTAAEQTAQAQAQLRAGRPFKRLTGTIVEIPGCLRGVHWDYGDYVTGAVKGEMFDCRINAVSVSVAGGVAKNTAVLRSE